MLDSETGKQLGTYRGCRACHKLPRQNATSSCSKSLNGGQVTRPSRGGVEKRNQK